MLEGEIKWLLNQLIARCKFYSTVRFQKKVAG